MSAPETRSASPSDAAEHEVFGFLAGDVAGEVVDFAGDRLVALGARWWARQMVPPSRARFSMLAMDSS